LGAAASAAGRDAAAVGLVAVTKKVEIDQALALVRLGQRDLGENRVADLEQKAAAFSAAGADVHWHFIGHLQRNKARRVVALAHTIHSVDSPRLLQAIQRHATELGRTPGLYLQVDLTGEEAKQGFTTAELWELLDATPDPGPCPLLGLMAMAPLEDPDGGGARRVFAAAAAMADEIAADPARASHFGGRRPRLSMGMSRDLEQAVAAGSDWVRVGRALFSASPPAGSATALGDGTGGAP
jgi:hypothetical protein